MAATTKTRKPVRRNTTSMRDIRAMRDHNPAPQELIDQTIDIKNDAIMQANLRGYELLKWAMIRAHHHIVTTASPTMSVILLGNGQVVLTMNPYFTISLQGAGALFVLQHETYHIVLKHLHASEELRNHPKWVLATESMVNYLTMARLKVTEMPQAEVEVLDPATGKVTKQVQPTGVDPREVHEKYVTAATKAGIEYLAYDDFYQTHHVTFSELCRVEFDDEQDESDGEGGMAGMAAQCVHGRPDSEGDGDADGDGSGGVPEDEETAEDAAKQILASAMRAAAQGSENAREELLALATATEDGSDAAKKIWGDLGIARLRGQTHADRKIDWWQQWLTGTLASKLEEGEKLRYVKKRGVIDLMLGNDPMLLHRGDHEVKRVLGALDTSGSMPQKVVDYITELVGYTDGVELHWCSFDGLVTPFVAGERVVGGGGTNFQNVVDYAEGRLEVNGHRWDEAPDAILMLTDAFADHVQPEEPEKWIWLITEGGDKNPEWIEDAGMEFCHITTGDGLA